MPNMFHKIKKIASGGQLTKVKEAYVFKDGEFQKVWSGASEVSYYDGDTLLGTEEVDEGEDVLHPSINTAKSGYTLYGWATSKTATERVESLNATGEPMRVYAIYTPNSILVAKSRRYTADSVKVDVWNTDYMSGSAYVNVTTYGGPDTAYTTFTINLGRYQNSSVKIWAYRYSIDDQGYGHDDPNSNITVDGVSKRTGDVLTNTSGTHTMGALAWTNWGNGERFVRMNGGLAEVILSNPIAWV